MMKKDIVIIGGGQAGLAMGYFLKQENMDFVILDAGSRVGDTWRNRYDSLVLFTPRRYSELPGYSFPGKPDGLPTKDEAADYLESYARNFDLPIQFHTKVTRLQQTSQGFRIGTDQGEIEAKQVVIATGPFQRPAIPVFAKELSPAVYQVHSSAYRNSSQLKDGPVVVVGAGNSGAQIAAELAKDRQVFISVGHDMSFKPLYVLGQSIFWYFDKLGLLRAGETTRRGAWLKNRPELIYGLELKHLLEAGTVRRKPRAVRVQGDALWFADGTSVQAPNVIWSTGFRSEYSWIDVPGALDSQGLPFHDKGIGPVQGMYFLGLPWQTCRGSALLGWVGRDAERIMHAMIGGRA
ncbi:flavin-containing monooxygenase [Paenibacillus sp. GD4]|uniref:flavin-containing monooxygenase n=1 Tax=Paenibacillus sp. GD4 TaxID=3068890 RepID=UPI00358E7259